MEVLINLQSKRDYCETIKPSSYEQSINTSPKTKAYQNINNLFIDHYDPTCSILDEKEKEVYTKQRIVEIATDIDEKSDTHYTNFNYSKRSMKSSLIQTGLQTPNNLSSVIYLGDLYKVTPIIYIDHLKLKIITSCKDRCNLHILYRDGAFTTLDDIPDFKPGTYENLKECFVLNLKNLDVYNTPLQPISKYKMPELVEIAENNNIPLHVHGKKKVKKQLYDDINVYYINNPTASN